MDQRGVVGNRSGRLAGSDLLDTLLRQGRVHAGAACLARAENPDTRRQRDRPDTETPAPGCPGAGGRS
jgi:hypothetical protein